MWEANATRRAPTGPKHPAIHPSLYSSTFDFIFPRWCWTLFCGLRSLRVKLARFEAVLGRSTQRLQMFKNSKVFVVGPLNGEEASDGMAIHGPRRAQRTPPGP